MSFVSQLARVLSRRRCLAALAGSALASPKNPVEYVDVFRAGEDGFHTFRIPALLATRKGTLLAFAEGRRSSRGDSGDIDLVLKSALAHLWFVTLHPFDDGNGRMARAIADMLLARSEKSPQRFYSMSTQIRTERTAYYDILEQTQKATLDVTAWMEWFLREKIQRRP